MQVVIQNANQVWSSPDGQRRIYEITYTDPSGNLVTAKTYSDKIGQGKGQSFDIETYIKQGKNGQETFAKQVETQSSGYGQASVPSNAPQERQFKADPQKQSSIERQSALKSAVEAVNGMGGGGFDSRGEYADAVIEVAGRFVGFISGTPEALSQVMPGAQVVDDNQPTVESYQPPVQDSLV